jgi:hypothetical protein
MPRMDDFDRVRHYLIDLQDRICTAIETVEGAARFIEDAWTREPGGAGAGGSRHASGGGRTRILRDGAVFEQAGIGFSDVRGTELPSSATAARPELAGASWRAAGLSLVFHPRNPHVPTTHANVRFFQAQRSSAHPERVEGQAQDERLETVAWWFGGGFDLTPFYPVDEDVVHWHRTARVRRRPLRRAQALVRRVFLPQAPQRDARHRRPVLRRPAHVLRPGLRLPAGGRKRLPRCLPADRRAPPRYAVWRTRAPVPAVPARSLRRIQPVVGSRHAVRDPIRRSQ